MHWRKEIAVGNDSKAMPVWKSDQGYEISQNINASFLDPKRGWEWEVLFKSKFVMGPIPTLEMAKKLAADHWNLQQDID